MHVLSDIAWPLVILVLGCYAIYSYEHKEEKEGIGRLESKVAELEAKLKGLNDKLGALQLGRAQRPQ